MNSCFQRTLSLCKIAVLVAMCCLFASKPVRAKRKDIVIMNNGDRFTGEVKSLQNGVLYVETDYVADKIGVDWAQVQSVNSSAVYQITLVNGVHMTGKIKRE